MSANRNRPAGNGAAQQITRTARSDFECIPAQLTRRRAAARRLPTLDCGCRDPWTCLHRPEPELTETYVAGWRDAARHLAEAGIAAAVPVPVLRVLWRRGGTDRALAELLHRQGVDRE